MGAIRPTRHAPVRDDRCDLPRLLFCSGHAVRVRNEQASPLLEHDAPENDLRAGLRIKAAMFLPHCATTSNIRTQGCSRLRSSPSLKLAASMPANSGADVRHEGARLAPSRRMRPVRRQRTRWRRAAAGCAVSRLVRYSPQELTDAGRELLQHARIISTQVRGRGRWADLRGESLATPSERRV